MDSKEQFKGGAENQEPTEAEKVLGSMPSFDEHMTDVNKEDNREGDAYLTDTAIESIAGKLSLDKNELKNALLGNGPKDILDQAQSKILEYINDDDYEEACDFILEVKSDVHDEWCSKNSDKFFDRDQFNNRYKFLDFSLIGDPYSYDEVTSPIFKKLGVEDIDDYDLDDEYYHGEMDMLRDEYSMEEEDDIYVHQYREGDDPSYDEWLEEMRVGYPEWYEDHVRMYDHLNEENALGRYQETEDMTDDPFEYDDRPLLVITEPITHELGRGCYFAEDLHENPSKYLSKGASEKIAEAIEDSFNTAAEITMQVGEQGSGDEEADWGCLWAYHNRGGEGVYDYWYQNYDPFATNDDYFNSQEYINDGWN